MAITSLQELYRKVRSLRQESLKGTPAQNVPVRVQDLNDIEGKVNELVIQVNTNTGSIPDVYTYKEIIVSSAQIKAMGTTPVTLIVAPGVGKYYDFVAVVEYTHVTTAYTFTGDMILIGGANSYGGGLIGKGLITVAEDKVAKVTHSPTEIETSFATEYPITWAMNLNEGIILTALNGTDPTTGDGTILIKIRYKIKTTGTEL